MILTPGYWERPGLVGLPLEIDIKSIPGGCRRYTPCAAAHEFTHRSTMATRVVISIKVLKLTQIRLSAVERSRIDSMSVAGRRYYSTIEREHEKNSETDLWGKIGWDKILKSSSHT
jgi:hypothetical protein